MSAIKRAENRSPLSAHDVRTIRTALDQGASVSDLASRYNVSRMTITRIRSGKTWKTITPEPMHPSVREHKANHIVGHWADQLRRNPDKLEALLHKTITQWPDHRVDTAYHKLTDTTEPSED